MSEFVDFEFGLGDEEKFNPYLIVEAVRVLKVKEAGSDPIAKKRAARALAEVERMVTEGLREVPELAAPTYYAMAADADHKIRLFAAKHIGEAFDCDREGLEPVWQQLVKDTDPLVARSAKISRWKLI